MLPTARGVILVSQLRHLLEMIDSGFCTVRLGHVIERFVLCVLHRGERLVHIKFSAWVAFNATLDAQDPPRSFDELRVS
jgi:hypothetical protein